MSTYFVLDTVENVSNALFYLNHVNNIIRAVLGIFLLYTVKKIDTEKDEVTNWN